MSIHCEDNGRVRVSRRERWVLATDFWTREGKARVRWDHHTNTYYVMIKRHDGDQWVWECEWELETHADAIEALTDDVLPRLANGEFEEALDIIAIEAA